MRVIASSSASARLASTSGRRAVDVDGRPRWRLAAAGGRRANHHRSRAVAPSTGSSDDDGVVGGRARDDDEVKRARDGDGGRRGGRGRDIGRRGARAALRVFLSANRAEGKEDDDRTLENVRTLAERLARECRCDAVELVWAPALWAVAATRWSRREALDAVEWTRGKGAEYLIEKYASRRDFEACEAVYEVCVKGGWDDAGGAGRVAIAMAKALDASPNGKGADAMWRSVFDRARGSVKERVEAHCAMLEGRCLQSVRFDAFMRSYEEFRRDFWSESDGEWKRGCAPVHVQRVFTAACRLINNSHNAAFARKVMFDLLREHRYLYTEKGYTLITDYCVCALIGSAGSNVQVAAELFEVALESGAEISGQTWSYVVSMYVREGMIEEAMATLDRLESLSFMQSGSLGALAFAAAFSFDETDSLKTEVAEKKKKRASELKATEARNAKQRTKVERAYAEVMGALNKSGQAKLALRIFTRMQSSGVRPVQAQTYRSLYDALQLSGDDTSFPRQILHRTMQTIRSHLTGVDALMVTLEVAAHAGVADACQDVHDRLKWHGHLENPHTRSRVMECMMIAMYKSQDHQGVAALYEEFRRKPPPALGVDFWLYLIKSHCDEPANIEVAMLMLDEATRYLSRVNGRSLPVIAFNVILQACARSKRPMQALKVIESARRGGVSLTHVTYLCAIQSCASAAAIRRSDGDDDENLVKMARRLLGEMRGDGLRPTPKIWSAVLSACACAGDVDSARQLFSEMQSNGCQPDVYSCNALITAHAVKGDLEGSVQSYWTMRREYDVLPNAKSLQAILEVARGSIRADGAHDGDLMAQVAEVYVDVRRLKVKPNNAIFALLTESWVEEALLSPSTKGKMKKLDFNETPGAQAESIDTNDARDEDDDASRLSWNDIQCVDVSEFSIAEARVSVLELLQTLRERRLRGLAPEGDVVVIAGLGKVRNEIQRLALDISLVLSVCPDNDGRLLLTRDSINHWLDKP